MTITSMNQESIIAHETLSLQHRIPNPSGLRLVHPRHGGPVNHLVERLQLPRRTIQPLTVKHRDKRKIRSKMILNSPLTTPHNKTEVPKSHLVELFED